MGGNIPGGNFAAGSFSDTFKNEEGMKIVSQMLKENFTVSFDSSLLLFLLRLYYLACFSTFKKKHKQPLYSQFYEKYCF